MDFFFSSVITLCLVMDPFGNIPLFVSALKKVAPERRKTVLIRELLIAMGITVAFLFLGKWFLQMFGINSFSMSIAGGIILFIISIKLVFSNEEETWCSAMKKKHMPTPKKKNPLSFRWPYRWWRGRRCCPS